MRDHLCMCGHPAGEHHGHCGAIESTLWGERMCSCPQYEYQGDE